MTDQGRIIRLSIDGLGIILYSPEAVRHIRPGEDYLSSHYMTPAAVQEHIQAGSIVGFGTGTPGNFLLCFRAGEPPGGAVDAAQFQLRLGIRTTGTIVCRDLYDLMSWRRGVPPGQSISVGSGIYRLTLLSSVPRSGVLGDNQLIEIYMEPVDSFPRLSPAGIPMLGAGRESTSEYGSLKTRY